MPSINAQVAWNAVVNHDRRFDERFWYAVSSTNVYCRPSCPSRRPARHRVTFFDSPQQAEAAGYRACLRCRPASAYASRTMERLEEIRRYLDEHADEPVTLGRLAEQFALSPFHLQRAFTLAVGISPKAYQNARRMERFASLLKRGGTVTDAIYEAGFGSTSRLYERAPAALGMTPSAFRAGGAGVQLRYATVSTAIGRLLVAATERGIAAVLVGDSDAGLVADLTRDYPKASIRRDPLNLKEAIRLILKCLDEPLDHNQMPLDVRGTPFQRKVWTALQQIPRGSTRTYREIAKVIGQPTAARAVARACATNPAALAIPCHRVIREDGRLAGYRWGLPRKKRLLDLERSKPDA